MHLVLCFDKSLPWHIDIIVKIDLITRSFCLCHYVQNGLASLAEETWLMLCKRTQGYTLELHLLDQIKISCYTEYKAFVPSLIYNNVNRYLAYYTFGTLSHTFLLQQSFLGINSKHTHPRPPPYLKMATNICTEWKNSIS